jgi:hypothetical protein
MPGDAISGVTLATNDTTSTSGNYKAGSYDLTPSAAVFSSGSSGNYAITYNNAGIGLTVNPAILTISGFAASNKTYDGGTTATISSNGSLSGIVGSDSVSLNTGTASATFDNRNVGTTHTLTASGYSLNSGNGNNDANNYNLTQPTAANVTISAKPITITANGQSGTYGGNVPSLTYGNSGLATGDAFTGTLTTAHGGAGTVLKHANGFDVSGSPFGITQGSLTINDGNAGNNYAITYNGANLTLAAKGLIVTADNKSMAYGSTDPALTYTYTGLVTGDNSANFTGALARTSGSSAGTYSILQNTLAATGDYTIGTYNPGVFTIDAAPIPPASTIPNTVLKVSQNPSLNMPNSSNSGSSFMTSAPTVPWGSQTDTNTNTPAPSENTNEPASHNVDTITSLSPAFGDTSDSDAKKDDKASSQPGKTQRVWLQIDPVRQTL